MSNTKTLQEEQIELHKIYLLHNVRKARKILLQWYLKKTPE